MPGQHLLGLKTIEPSNNTSMVKRGNGLSPQKNLRSSTRERTMVYRSLAENDLAEHHLRGSFMNSFIRSAQRMHKGLIRQPAAGYTRSGRRITGSFHVESDSSDDDEFVKGRRRRHAKERYSDRTVDMRSPSPKRSLRRQTTLESEGHESEKKSESGNQNDIRPNMYDSVKRERRYVTSTSLPGSPISNGSQIATACESARSLRKANRERLLNGVPKEADSAEVDGSQSSEETEEDDEEKTPEPRQYSLRKFRQPVDRFAVPTTFRDKHREDRERGGRNRSTDRKERKAKKAAKRRSREIRSDSSSTSSDSCDDHIRTRNDDLRFERRKERSLAKARNRYLPINLSEKDLTASQMVIRERLRQAGGSCTDIDPMSIDKSIGFEEIGGLGAHIQSLKEVVLFPMLYPEIFNRFNIMPPKGVVFYGPPGTGKTLMARALANECSRSGRRVAFFMRKGADCLSKWVGEAERQLRVLFDQAYAMRPSIIFFDEIDGLAPVRSSKQDQIHSSIVSTLLALMDGLDNRGEVVVIGATNRLDALDPALRRPGRFDRELKFSLPDSNARYQILSIHTAKWGTSQPNEETLRWLADGTSGYCGADLQYLCTEAVLVALRSRFPHIYMSKERLKLDSSLLIVDKECFTTAMRRIIPASRRDLSIPSRQLDERTSILLLSTVSSILNKNIPFGYRCSQSIQNTTASELEKVVRALEQPPCVPAVRLLLCGTLSYPDLSQTSYVLPAILGKLDHLPVFSIAVAKLFADGKPEETLAQTIQSALRSAANGPCVLLLPSIDQWYDVVPRSVAHMLATALDSLHGFTSILFLASCDCAYESCCDEAKDLFGPSQSISLEPPKERNRRRYFEHIVASAREPPKVFDASLYNEPEKADPEDQNITRKLNEREARELAKEYESQLRRFRIWARDKLSTLRRDRRFTIFVKPVDGDDVEDYYDVIKNPMCISEMEDKIDRQEYLHPDHLLSDIRLIRDNAIEYNPANTDEGRAIRHNAFALWETVVDLFDVDLDVDFVESLENNAKMLADSNVLPAHEKLLELPPGFKRTVPWSVNTGYMTQVVSDGDKSGGSKSAAPKAILPSNVQRVRFGTRHRGSYPLPCSIKKRKTAAILKSLQQSLSSNKDEGSHEQADKIDSSSEHLKCRSPSGSPEKRERKESASSVPENVLILPENELAEVVDKCVRNTHGWSVSELERLAAVMSQNIEEFKDTWNRSKLPAKLMATVTSWELKSK
ncbi:Lex-1p [Parelaphostrongylus tenuis]|uniref:Lex-1p n=1 Tax=Parelaphostrongylus tenuis TaxID=148309 RepID=A0AAD5NB57_PARTN|nr:Lex-1p [Parelaphostrongylus tenuis]